MTITNLNGKSICILGYGREGQATERALKKFTPDCTITIKDQKDGDDYLENLDRFDFIIKSPGIPPQPEFEAVKDKITNSTQIFLDTVKEADSLVIGITGTKGKSTTASLIYEILKAAKKDVYLVGNIGEPSIDHLDDAKEGTIFVLEMSSYQLMDMTTSPQIAVITSFFPEHLDYHGSIENYMDAKANIARHQTSENYVIYDENDDAVRGLAAHSKGDHIGFDTVKLPTNLVSKLKGAHNLLNIKAAYSVGKHFDVSDETVVDVISTFETLPHRMQSLGIHHGIEWIDDAISTIPESTQHALATFEGKIGSVILGGKNRGNDFNGLAKDLLKVPTIILFPESGARIKEALDQHNYEGKIHEVTSMQEAVDIAKKETKGICLLSPASPSYNMYKNFEEKGDDFKRLILNPA